jgi:hypothetical protein
MGCHVETVLAAPAGAVLESVLLVVLIPAAWGVLPQPRGGIAITVARREVARGRPALVSPGQVIRVSITTPHYHK